MMNSPKQYPTRRPKWSSWARRNNGLRQKSLPSKLDQKWSSVNHQASVDQQPPV